MGLYQGLLHQQPTTSTAYTGTSTGVYLMSQNSNSGYIAGTSDNFKLYNKALSSTEVNTLYTYENANPTLS